MSRWPEIPTPEPSGPYSASVQITATPREQRTHRGYRRIFDELFERGRATVLTQTHVQDAPPAEGGRWGMSVVLTTSQSQVNAQLQDLTRQAHALAGAKHWPTGARGSAHITVRSIERHRVQIPALDPLRTRCAAALERTAAQVRGPIRLRVHGLTLSPSGVMGCLYPIDPIDAVEPEADRFAVRLRTELGPDGWFEERYQRIIWHMSLLHFADHITQPSALVDWVHARRDLDLGVVEAGAAHLATFRHDGQRPWVVALATAPLTTMRRRTSTPA